MQVRSVSVRGSLDPRSSQDHTKLMRFLRLLKTVLAFSLGFCVFAGLFWGCAAQLDETELSTDKALFLQKCRTSQEYQLVDGCFNRDINCTATRHYTAIGQVQWRTLLHCTPNFFYLRDQGSIPTVSIPPIADAFPVDGLVAFERIVADNTVSFEFFPISEAEGLPVPQVGESCFGVLGHNVWPDASKHPYAGNIVGCRLRAVPKEIIKHAGMLLAKMPAVLCEQHPITQRSIVRPVAYNFAGSSGSPFTCADSGAVIYLHGTVAQRRDTKDLVPFAFGSRYNPLVYSRVVHAHDTLSLGSLKCDANSRKRCDTINSWSDSERVERQ